MTPELIAALSVCRDLPSPPAVAARLIELAQNPETDIASVADVIALDMGLSARMMRIANSPLYASQRRIDNLGRALTMLGLNATLQLALGFSLSSALRDQRQQQLHEAIWRRGILSALSARNLGVVCGVRRPDELMLAGLLQDIGMLALLQVRGDSYPALLAEHTNSHHLLAAEHALFGCSHADVGALLCEQWGMPEYLARAVRHSEPPAEPGDLFERCVALSGHVARIWLDSDTDAAHATALELTHAQLKLDSHHFEQVLKDVSRMLPDISALFEVPVPSPARVSYLIEHANELVMLRNLRALQDADAALQRADDYEQQARDLNEQAHLDALTGTLNRRALQRLLDQEFRRAQASGTALSIAFTDLDDFKKINDMHGHLVGDQVLQAFAHCVQSQLRGADTVARFGGEEFVALFPGSSEQTVVEIVRRVLQVVTQTPMAFVNDQPLYVTFSAGVATHGAYERFNDTHALLRAADDVLYRSKNLGRNRVIARAPGNEPAAR